MLRGSLRADAIVTGGGDDIGVAHGGDDLVCAGVGDDRLRGGWEMTLSTAQRGTTSCSAGRATTVSWAAPASTGFAAALAGTDRERARYSTRGVCLSTFATCGLCSARTLDRLAGGRLVGRRRELELVLAALDAGRHVLIEGPPGTGKSTLLRAVAGELGVGFEFVEGNAELTPARLVGHFDPARVLAEGYDPDVFVDGPLVTALRDGALLDVEERKLVPEETLERAGSR